MKSKKLGLVGRILLGIGILVGVAHADQLNITCKGNGSVYEDTMIVVHNDMNQSMPSTEGYDLIWDGLWTTPGDFLSLRPSSIVENYRCSTDTRPSNSVGTINLEFSVAHDGGSSEAVSTDVYLTMSINGIDGNFDGKPIIFQQINPSDPNEIYPIVDVRREIEENNGDILLYGSEGSVLQLNDSFPNGHVHTNGTISFNRWLADINGDKKVDLEDLAVLSENYGRTGITEYGPAVIENYADINRDGNVDVGDLIILSKEWLEDYSGNLGE